MTPEEEKFLEEAVKKEGVSSLWGSMKRGAILNMSLHLSLFGWISWHHWTPIAASAFWSLSGLLFFGWKFGDWSK